MDVIKEMQIDPKKKSMLVNNGHKTRKRTEALPLSSDRAHQSATKREKSKEDYVSPRNRNHISRDQLIRSTDCRVVPVLCDA